VFAALAVIYVVWGSTYLAIRIMVETLPPLLCAGIRFLVAGAVLAAILLLRGGPRRFAVPVRELGGAAVIGAALLMGGNGGITVGEKHVPSALTALVAASIPLWVVVLRRLSGERVSFGTLAGVALGFAGVALLVSQGGEGTVDPGAMLLVVAGAASWAAGTFASSRIRLPADPLVSTALQMLIGGALLFALGLVLEPGGIPADAQPRSWLALGYLIVFGSLLAFTAYTWLLAHAPVSQVATYAYVNPVIALILGWAVLAEAVTAFVLVGAVLVVVAVALVIRHEARPLPDDLAAASEGG
jgi:drug/metabolite transporter (DMT)-like permease